MVPPDPLACASPSQGRRPGGPGPRPRATVHCRSRTVRVALAPDPRPPTDCPLMRCALELPQQFHHHSRGVPPRQGTRRQNGPLHGRRRREESATSPLVRSDPIQIDQQILLWPPRIRCSYPLRIPVAPACSLRDRTGRSSWFPRSLCARWDGTVKPPSFPRRFVRRHSPCLRSPHRRGRLCPQNFRQRSRWARMMGTVIRRSW